jgi:hypothetical protein
VEGERSLGGEGGEESYTVRNRVDRVVSKEVERKVVRN